MLLGAICTAALVGCGGGDGGDDGGADPTTTAPTTTQSQEAEDEEALRQLAEDWFVSVRSVYIDRANPDDLAAYAAGPYLEGVLDQIAEFEATGNEAQPGDQTRHEVLSVEVDDASASLVECVIDSDRVLSPDGDVINDEVQANLYETEARRLDGGWRLTGRSTLEEVDGSDQCPAQ
ncbi:hypothetical protein HC251_05655 [Iamia sp. SCSIO 61187]|uniref:nuclear transport factor 2 family protein n=1 Tax=Iamia sp. SCSIO 61187 TaxID=2722752 RepID=UPI001C624EAC|nr:nuclear transport factor 2 family protein [Iamia sp. SCSIO 61187]QYG91971.1 hypothetical protein HC251_05655 [Iamia sp. SCSIO 61187]